MGGRGSSSGMASKESFTRIRLDGKTGTEKQRKYAENLVESVRLTAKSNGVSGYSDAKEGSMRRYISQEDADSVKGAYKFLKVSVQNRATYGEVIDLLKNNDILSLANTIKRQSMRSGKSISQFVNDYIDLAQKKKK